MRVAYVDLRGPQWAMGMLTQAHLGEPSVGPLTGTFGSFNFFYPSARLAAILF